MDRHTEVTLQPDGSISSTVNESSTGQTAVKERRWLKHLSKSEYDKMIERWIGHGAMGAKLSRVTPIDSPVAGNFNLNVEFSASNYAQLMQGRLLVFKPAITNRLNHLEFTDAKRKYPIALDAVSFTEMVRIKLPTGFDVDETPDGVKIDTSFGSYSAKFEVSDGNLVFTRSLVQKSGIIPPEQYTALRTFYGRIRAYKGLEYLVAAFQQIAAGDNNYRLIIAGDPKKESLQYWRDIQRTIEREETGKRVIQEIRFVPDEETELYFKAADVLVLPYTEIFQSGVLFLAYGFGLPVIATDVGSLRDDIIEGQTGFMCRPSDAADLAEVLKKYFDSSLFHALDRKRGEIKAFARSRNSWNVVGDITRAVYGRLLAKRN